MKGQGVARRTMRGVAKYSAVCSVVNHVIRVGLILLLVLSVPSSAAEEGVIPRFTEEPESAIVAHHRPVTLRCSAEPPSARVSWLFNGQPLEPGSHRGLQRRGSDLHFPHFSHGAEGSHGNDGEYRCTATTSAGTAVSRPARLSKPVLRRFPASDDIVIKAYEGGYATIPCSAPYSQPPATVRVLTSRGQLLDEAQDNVHRLPSGSVVLTQLQLSDSDNYTCIAFNPVSGHNRSASHSVRLTVTPKSRGIGEESTVIVDRSTPTLQVKRGDSVLLECPVAGLGTPSIVWTRGYGTLPQGHVQEQFGNMRISSVKLRDSGTYMCETPTGQKRQVVLEVQMAPTVNRQPESGEVEVEEGDSVRLVCKGGAFPAPSVTWFHNGKVHGRPGMKSGGEGHSLSLHQVRKDQEGLYTCELSNSLGEASAVLQLTVLNRRQEGHRDTQRDNPVDGGLEDGAAGGITPADSEDTDNNRNFHLEVSNNNNNNNNNNRKGRKKNKNGKKRNGRKKDKKKWKTKKVKLVPPSAPTLSRLSETSVMVHWTVPDNDGLPISLFRVQYKEVKPNKGQWKTVDDDISAKSRRYKVGRLKAGGTYKFRIAAVYSNNDNRNSRNSRRFHLNINPSGEMRPPKDTPRVVEAKPIIYQNIYAIGIKWQYLPAHTSSITGFYIYYKPYGSKDKFKMERLLGPNIRNHLLINLQADTEYSIKMQCFNEAGASDFSNVVVKRTLPIEGQSTPNMLPPLLPPEETETKASTTSGPDVGGLDQPVILGVVLGVMLLLLIVFIAMCWWKQRQQKRHNQQLEAGSKFQDQSHRLYTDMSKKHPNGGPYPLHGMNGLALANGHGPPHDQQMMSCDLGPHEQIDGIHHCSRSPSQRDLYSGKPYHQVLNGTIPGYGHSNNSDNNFNNIRHTASSDNVLSPSGVVPNGFNSVGSSQHRGRAAGGYSSQYPPPSHSRTSPSSFPPSSSQHHKDGSLSQSEDADSMDEAEPLNKGNLHYAGEAFPSLRTIQDRNRDNMDRAYEQRPCYGYNGSYDSVSRSGYRDEGSGYHHWSVGTASSPSSSSHTGKHKRRRKRPHGEREHTMKDQATNTDLSSNEGTIEFSMLNKSPAGSVSNGSDNSTAGDTGDSHPQTDPSCAGGLLASPPLTVSAMASL